MKKIGQPLTRVESLHLFLPSAINEETKLHETRTLFFKELLSYKSDTERTDGP